MKYTAGPIARLELTRRNLTALLDKLDDPYSTRTLLKDAEDEGIEFFPSRIMVTAVEDEAHYSNRAPGEIHVSGSGE